jgi:tetratricopeptide (TPR) repeat protein
LRLALASWWFWVVRGYFAEGSHWMDAALARATERSELRARALSATAILDVRRGVVERREALLDEAVEIRRAIGEPRAIARGLRELGDHLILKSDHVGAQSALAEALELCGGRDDIGEAAGIRLAQGLLAHYHGDPDGARRRLGQSMRLLEDASDAAVAPFWAVGIAISLVPEGPGGAPRCFFEGTSLMARTVARRSGMGHVLCNVAATWRREGELDAACDALERALGIFRDAGDREGAALALNALGCLARAAREPELGRESLDEALALRREIGNRRDIGVTLASMGLLATSEGDGERGRALLAEAQALFERTEDGPALAGMAQNIGCLELDHGDPERACALLARSAAMWDDMRVLWNRSWIQVVQAQAAAAAGDPQMARAALADARDGFEHLGEAAGLAHVAAVQAAAATR